MTKKMTLLLYIVIKRLTLTLSKTLKAQGITVLGDYDNVTTVDSMDALEKMFGKAEVYKGTDENGPYIMKTLYHNGMKFVEVNDATV